MVKKKLCLVIPSLQPGGMERVMSELAGFFCQKNELEVHMVLYGKDPELFYHVPESLIIHEPVTTFNNKLRLFYTFGRLLYLRRRIKSIEPNTVLSFGEYWNSFVLLIIGIIWIEPSYLCFRSLPTG
jgi:GalNAc-alpha-(1->4)-GalNAc-alpha-(1->3)-diNAcBac-PP-undecaprenol alpha-1,4-N-acetyl-D-galactosaminyltransferase